MNIDANIIRSNAYIATTEWNIEPVKRKMLFYNYMFKASQLKWNGFTHSKYLENVLEIIQHSYF